MQLRTPKKFGPSHGAHSSGPVSQNGVESTIDICGPALPALLTRMSIGPTSASAAATIARTLSISVTSHCSRQAARTLRLDLGGDGLGAILEEVVDDDRGRAMGGEVKRDLAPHAPPGAGHERYFPFEAEQILHWVLPGQWPVN